MAKLEPFVGESDKARLQACLRGEKTDRVPNFEILIEDQHVEKLLGRKAGNTLGVGGDPAKGSEAAEGVRPTARTSLGTICGDHCAFILHDGTTRPLPLEVNRLSCGGKKGLVNSTVTNYTTATLILNERVRNPLGVLGAAKRYIDRVTGALRRKRLTQAEIAQIEIAQILGVESKGIDPLTEMPMYHDPVTQDTFIANDLDEGKRRLTEIRIGFGHPPPRW